MNAALVDRIVNAVLYEGYILYPYRPAVKNRQRWTFGGIYPRAFSDAHGGSDAWSMQTECLVQGTEPGLQVRVRFLHLISRQVGELSAPCDELPENEEPAFRTVEQLQVGDRLLLAWQEAVERDHPLGDLDLVALIAEPCRTALVLPACRQLEPVRGPGGRIDAVVVREQRSVSACIEVSAERVAGGLFKVRVRIENHTPLDDFGRDGALLRSIVSTHTILGAHGGAFVSLLDPPSEWRKIAGSCRNIGTWPVLVGENAAKDTMLSSPIILDDYQEIAPESPGDFFDGTEIDEMLTLRILTLTDEEKNLAAALDERARALLQRTATLDRQHRMGLHGTVRGMRCRPEGGDHDR